MCPVAVVSRESRSKGSTYDRIMLDDLPPTLRIFQVREDGSIPIKQDVACADIAVDPPTVVEGV